MGEPKPTPIQTNKTKPTWLFLTVGIIAMVIIVVLIALKTPKTTKITTTPARQVTVQITADGFNPSDVVVKKGTIVKWINADSQPHRVAANPYPSHSDLPDLDSKDNLGPDSTYSYTFGQTGTFSYHDEVKPSSNGSITVK